MQHNDKTGAVHTDELVELNDLTAAGGTATPTTSSWTCVTFATISVCPTSACTSRCKR